MIDYEFLKDLRGKDEITVIVPEPEKIQRVKERINLVNQELVMNKLRVKTMMPERAMEIFAKEDVKAEKKVQKEKKKSVPKKIKSLPSVKGSEPCPEGYIRSPRTGRCIKDKKYKLMKAKRVNVDNSILNILKEIKGM